jgi:pyruvate dehydrogenase E2 component (dihydrolipoamide acetyltransferase)
LAIENIKVPDLGDAAEVEVIELLVSVGQAVAEDDSLLVLESDKAAMEIPAPMAGVIKSIAVNLGDQVTTGSEMLTLEVESATVSPSVKVPKEKPTESSKDTPNESSESGEGSELESSPETVSEKQQVPAGSNSAIASNTIEVPDIGTDDEVDVIEIHVKVGGFVAVDDPLVTLESDKAAMEVPSPQLGEITELLVSIGDKVKTGSAIAIVKGNETQVSSNEIIAPTALVDAPGPAIIESAPTSAGSKIVSAVSVSSMTSDKVYAGPAVRKLARELGVDMALVPGTGAKNRITKEDIQGFVKNRLNTPAGSIVSAVPDIDFSKFGEIEQIPRTKIAKITAVNMHRNWTTVPHVAQFNEADVTDLEEFRAELKVEAEKKGVKLTFLPFLLKACAKALKEYPQFNVSIHSSGEYLIQKKYFHIGVAVATEEGLVVPVIRNVDKKSILELAAEVADLSDKARQRKLSLEDLQGACFSISSLGAIGGTGFTPIVNAPEVAILGVAKTEIKPVYMEGEFKPRKMLPITLAYDHKAVNGVDGGLFATYLAKLLADIRHLVL